MENNKKSLTTQNTNGYKKNNDRSNNNSSTPTYIYALGGLGEVGKNMYVLEEGNDLWIVDAGIMFSGEEHAGTEGIIQSYEQLQKNQKKIKGLIITHGHEDHIGAIPYLLKQVRIPVIYAPKLASELIRHKIKDKTPGAKANIKLINNESKLKSNNFNISFFNVNHSIPDSLGVNFESKNGRICTTGDFKFDLSPIGHPADFAKISTLGQKGVTLLMADSTNSMVEGFSTSESDVSNNLEKIISKVKGRLIVASFASNVYRVKTLIELGIKYGRKVLVYGRSMERGVMISRRIKYINVHPSSIIDGRDAKKLNDEEVQIVCTGSQGESLAALNRMSEGRHKEVKIRSTDTVIFSSSPIPGNFLSVEGVINRLIKLGVNVIENHPDNQVHASGHGAREEQKLMLALMKPKNLMPVHGEYRMLIEHAETAKICGMKKENIFITKNGGRIQVLKGKVSYAGNVPADDIFIDGKDVGGVTGKIVSDRRRLGKHGVISLVVGINSKENTISDKPKLITKGCFKYSDNKGLVTKLEELTENKLNEYFKSGEKITFSGIKDVIRSNVEESIFQEKKREPIVIPVILSKS